MAHDARHVVKIFAQVDFATGARHAGNDHAGLLRADHIRGEDDLFTFGSKRETDATFDGAAAKILLQNATVFDGAYGLLAQGKSIAEALIDFHLGDLKGGS